VVPLGSNNILGQNDEVQKSPPHVWRDSVPSFSLQHTIVILLEQVRVSVWIEILKRLREGSYTDEDISEVQILTNKDCDVP
jgi:hypothetical protein